MRELQYRLFFKAFSNNTRFEIINLLKKRPENVKEIGKKLGFEQSRVSHNLKCLEDCGFITAKQNGKQRIYELDKKHMIPILKNMEEHIKMYNKRLKNCGVIK